MCPINQKIRVLPKYHVVTEDETQALVSEFNFSANFNLRASLTKAFEIEAFMRRLVDKSTPVAEQRKKLKKFKQACSAVNDTIGNLEDQEKLKLIQAYHSAGTLTSSLQRMNDDS